MDQPTVSGLKNAQRQSNFELLRIFAMLGIIATHFVYHGGFRFASDTITVNRLYQQFLFTGGNLGVNLFVLISGYFLVTSHGIKTEKLLKMWLQVFTYSVVLYLIFMAAGRPLSVKELVQSLLPITFSQWWFASTYFVMYLLSPFVSKLLRALDRKTYQRMLVLTGILWCLIPTVTASDFQSNQLLWFFVLYAFAGYVRLYGIQAGSAKRCLLCAAAACALTFLSVIVFDILGTHLPVFADHALYGYHMQRLPVAATSVLVFLGFSKINIGCRKTANTIAAATFGVYLIHDNRFVREFLWHTLFRQADFAGSPWLIPYSIAVVLSVFICAAGIELARQRLLERACRKPLNRLAAWLDGVKEKFYALPVFDKL